MREIASEIVIHCSPDLIWQVLTETSEYPQWNPFIRRIEGALKSGDRLRIMVQPPGGRTMTFRPRLLTVDEKKEIRWIGHLILPGLLDGEHTLLLREQEENRVLFIQKEQFQGILTPLIQDKLFRNTLRGFEQMNLALKDRAESIFVT
jgi:hypothetical protein